MTKMTLIGETEEFFESVDEHCPETKVVVEFETDSLVATVESFKKFLLAVGYSEFLVNTIRTDSFEERADKLLNKGDDL